ncbi:hypothetical protein IB276_33335 [Ensifer sp. ENS04]|uniref:hypothetical protein n=1 Tax=Ensifer sp. ENS04 TaxID=2769281 RepID=UPI0017811EB1|nr:hypothetical protein [Ensifer sp. ENS04]MBD9544332.1 hypothetical protein [Ensifer sp. ENS04]
MRILLEVLERDRFEIYDPCVPAAAETEKILKEAEGFDTVRILKFDPATLQISDMTPELVREYTGPFDDTAPLWIKQSAQFDDLAAEERREVREWIQHLRAA